jgi:hypothetical protein
MSRSGMRCCNTCPQISGGPGQAYITQNGWDLNLVNEVGQPSRAWVDWPGHIWAQSWNEGAVYSPDGMVVQFDRGSVWVRNLALLHPCTRSSDKGWRCPRARKPTRRNCYKILDFSFLSMEHPPEAKLPGDVSHALRVAATRLCCGHYS